MVVKNSKLTVLKQLNVIKRISAADELFHYLKERILSGELKPGEALPTELELCEHMGVGRSTIREAMRALVNMNFIVRTKRGSFVSKNPSIYNILPFSDILKRVHLKDIIEFRIMLESEVAASSAKNATKSDLKGLQDAFENMKNAKDIDALIQSDTLFHVNLGIASHNELFLKVLEMIRNELADQMYEVFSRDISIRDRAILHHDKKF